MTESVTMTRRIAQAALVSAFLINTLMAQTPRTYWADEVPAGWNGKPSPDLLTVPEKSHFTRTTSTIELHEWIAALKLKSEVVHIVSMFTSPRGKVAPAIVIGQP